MRSPRASRSCPKTASSTACSSTSPACPTYRSHRSISSGGYGTISLRRETDAGRELIVALAISSSAEHQEVGHLSGGNQQKIVIARWLFAGAELFILDEPTQGIDIGARVAVYELINRLTAHGKSVILISSDHDELLMMSDRSA